MAKATVSGADMQYLGEPAFHSGFGITERDFRRTGRLHLQDVLKDTNPFLQNVRRVS